MFRTNIGTADRMIRILLGLALLSVPLWYAGELRWYGLIGAVPLLTALFRFCPLYTLIGVNTCAVRD